MSINRQRIDRLTAAEVRVGTPVFASNGKKLGTVGEVTETSLKVSAPLQRDYWVALTYVVEVQDDVVMMSFDSSDAGAYKQRAPTPVEEEAPVPGEVLLSEDEQREQRERMARELADQRRDLPHGHPDGESQPPDTGGTIGEPVEAELARLESEGVDALDVRMQERGVEPGGRDETLVRDEVLAPPTFGDSASASSITEPTRDDGSVSTIEDEPLEPSFGAPLAGEVQRDPMTTSSGYGDPAAYASPERDSMLAARDQAMGVAREASEQLAARDVRDYLALAQGAFFAVGGIWPVLHRRSFEAVTGPKTDFWLVKTVGLLLTSIGGVLMLAGARKRGRDAEPQALALSSAAALGVIDYVYVRRGRISRVYLLDLIAQAGFIGSWLAAPMLRGATDAMRTDAERFGEWEPNAGGSGAGVERALDERSNVGPSAHPGPITR